MSDHQDLIRITIAGRTLEEWTDFARTDRCLDQMVPSDLRMLVASHRDATATIARLRVAALPAVTAPQPLSVWVGPMPESNGKSNFTASLHKVGGDVHLDGFCFARSEYPDRVRYEADRVRWIIGEVPERPRILDYDADLHSGYVPPPREPDPQIATLQATNARLVEALRTMMQAVCGPTGFAEAVRHNPGFPFPWPSLDKAEANALALLAELEAKA